MTKKFVQPGLAITFTSAPYAVASGDGVLVNELFGVAVEGAAISTPVTASLSGVHSLKKEAALAINQGDAVYWDDAAKEVDTTNTNVPIGYCFTAALAADASVEVLLNNASP